MKISELQIKDLPSTLLLAHLYWERCSSTIPSIAEYNSDFNAVKINKLVEDSKVDYIKYYRTPNSSISLIEMVIFNLPSYTNIKVLMEFAISDSIDITKETINDLVITGSVYFLYSNITLNELNNIYDKWIVPCKEELIEPLDFSVISQNSYGLDLIKVKTDKFDIDLETNYNDGFCKIYENTLNELKNNTRGVVIFDGDPGTGKTMCLRKLIWDISKFKKNIIFLPGSLATAIANPDFVSLLLKYEENSIVIIEDADTVIQSRKSGNMSVANLLSIADGLLSDVLKIQLVVTLNVGIKNVDNALLREGRLLQHYTFKPLDATKATNLSKKIGHNRTYDQPTTLAQIYNPDKLHKKEPKIKGFSKK